MSHFREWWPAYLFAFSVLLGASGVIILGTKGMVDEEAAWDMFLSKHDCKTVQMFRISPRLDKLGEVTPRVEPPSTKGIAYVCANDTAVYWREH